MEDRVSYSGPTKLLLAFDVGTTYSSVSYCLLQPHQVPEILAVTRFSAQEIACADVKVPSLPYYDKAGALRAVGAEVLTQDVIETAVNEEWSKAEWWKLRLCPNHLASLDDGLPPLPPRKSAVDVLTDFVKYLFDCSKSYIRECHPTFPWSSVEHSIEYTLTYPGGWADQRYLYLQAIQRAGLVPNTAEGLLRVHLMTEGEAGLHFCISHPLHRDTTTRAAQGVGIIDAGGGIINLNMFSVTSDPISCEEIAPAECMERLSAVDFLITCPSIPLARPQGAVLVTCRAKALMERKLAGWEHSSLDDIARFTREFDQTTKLVIESDQEPVYLKVADRRTNNSSYCITSGRLKLSGEEATGLFNDSVDAIIDAFEQQQKSAQTPIGTVFFVGGLSTNEWVWSRLQSYFMARRIRILRPDSHSYKMVAKGAMLSRVGHENHLGYELPVKAIDKDSIGRKSPLRHCLSQIFQRLLVLVRSGFRRLFLGGKEILKLVHADRMP